MSNAVQAHHPAVVLRANYLHLRALLAVALVAIIGLTIAVVVLAVNNGTVTSAAPRVNRVTVQAQPTVQPNPDEQGVAVSPTPNISYFYPGHF